MPLKTRTRRPPDDWQPQADSPLPPKIQALLAARGVYEPESADLADLPDWRTLKGINEATAQLVRVLEAQGHILVIGDYDADGATGVALAVSVLTEMVTGDGRVSYLVPNRFEHGYGLSPELAQIAASMTPDLVVTVDHGISSVQGIKLLADKDIGVVVTDHHLPGDELPAAVAIVNPNQVGCDFVGKNLAGVGVMLFVLIALRACLREIGYFTERNSEPNLAVGLDLVALGTIADVVPLDSLNRCLVSQGLARIRSGQARPGIAELALVAKVELNALSSKDLAFYLAPRLNAAGRMQDMAEGIRCLLAPTVNEAKPLAAALDEHNRTRRTESSKMSGEAEAALARLKRSDAKVSAGLCLASSDWHPGLIGILAGRLRDSWKRPALILAPADVGAVVWRGSARSIDGLHIRDALALLDTRYPKLLQSYGGHAMAAGLSVQEEAVPKLQSAFETIISELVSDEMLSPEIVTDGCLDETDFTLMLASDLRVATPWGKDFPEPIFHGDFIVQNMRFLGANTLKMRVQPVFAGSRGYGGLWLDAINFNMPKADWPGNVKQVRLVYELDLNHYRNIPQLQLIVRAQEQL